MNKLPIIRAINAEQWELMEPMTFAYGFTVPKGFVTDLASIPKWLWFIGRPTNIKFQRAAVAHDWLLSRVEVPKCRADRVFFELLKEDGVSLWKARIMYITVKVFG